MKSTLLVLVFFFSVYVMGQTPVNYSAIDSKIATIPSDNSNSIQSIADYINANFKTENDKIRAVFYWTTSNISYDVANIFAVNIDETPQDRI